MPHTGHRRRDALAVRLGATLIGLVLAFDFCSVLAPGLAGRPLGAGGIFTLGVLAAILIVVAVVATAVYYVCWLDHEDPDQKAVAGQRPH